MEQEYSAYSESSSDWIKFVGTAKAIKALGFIDEPGKRKNDE
jgi:hypothetical protein